MRSQSDGPALEKLYRKYRDNRNGAVATAAQGDQGYADLRKLLTKAGLESE